MKYIPLVLIPFLTSCGVNMDILHGLAKVTNDNAITIEIQREALDEHANIEIGLMFGTENPKPPKEIRHLP